MISAATRAPAAAARPPWPRLRRAGATDVGRREQRGRHDGDAGGELPGLKADGVADAGDHAEVDGEVDGLGPGGGRLERLLRDRGHAVAQHVLERKGSGAEAVEDGAGGPVRRSRPPADERKVRRRDDAELQRPRPARRRRVQRLGRDLVDRRERDHAEAAAELAGEDLQDRDADERVAAEHQRRRAGGDDVGQPLVRLHEGDGRVVAGRPPRRRSRRP